MGCGLKKTNSWGLSVSCMEGESVSLSQCKMKAHFVKFNCQTITCTKTLVTNNQISNLSVMATVLHGSQRPRLTDEQL